MSVLLLFSLYYSLVIHALLLNKIQQHNFWNDVKPEKICKNRENTKVSCKYEMKIQCKYVENYLVNCITSHIDTLQLLILFNGRNLQSVDGNRDIRNVIHVMISYLSSMHKLYFLFIICFSFWKENDHWSALLFFHLCKPIRDTN